MTADAGSEAKASLSQRIGTDPSWAGRARLSMLALPVMGVLVVGVFGWLGNEVWSDVKEGKQTTNRIERMLARVMVSTSMQGDKMMQIESDARDYGKALDAESRIVFDHGKRINCLEHGVHCP